MRFLKIITKDRSLIPFEINHYQQRLIDRISLRRQSGRPLRLIVLKARQVGISTLSAAYTYFQAATGFFQKSVLVAHDLDSSANLFNIVKRFYDLSPEAVKPMKRYSNRKELVFENPDELSREKEPGLLSSINIETAGSSTAGRSSTIHHLHLSELAYWPNAAETLSGLMQALSTDNGSTCIIESTANGFNGIGNEFYKRCKAAQEGESDFEFFFIPWWSVSEYCIDASGIGLSTEEREISKRFNLTTDQMAWRRWKIRNDFGGDEKLFQQEYPASPEEAFIHSGRPVFDIKKILADVELIRDVQCQRDGVLKIFERPRDREVYVIGADVAEGIAGGDHSACVVLDRNFQQVASIKCRMDPDRFGAELIRVAKMYNNALLAWETNNHGVAVSAKVKNDGYTNVYRRELFDKHAIDIGDRIGWQTNVKTKALMIDEFIAAYRDNAIKIKDEDLLREMMQLAYEDDGNIILNSRDLTVSASIAIQALKQAPVAVKYKAQLMEDEFKEPRVESFIDRQKRLARRTDSYFG